MYKGGFWLQKLHFLVAPVNVKKRVNKISQVWGQYLRSYKVTKSNVSCFSFAFYFLGNSVYVLFFA